MIKAVFIDVDDTLLDWQKNAHKAMDMAAQSMNIYLPEDIMNTFNTINDSLWHSYEQKEIEKKDIYERRWKEIFAALGYKDINSGDFERKFVENLHFCYIPMNYAQEIMIYLSTKYEVYIASNASYSQQIDRLKGCGFDKYTKDIFVSEAAGSSKPQKEFFDYCFKNLEFLPSEVVMIGDSLNADISGAHQYGLKTIWVNSHDKEKNEQVDYEITTLKEIENIL